jgi:hypothetical protein
VISAGAVGPNLIVFFAPLLDQNLGLHQRRKQFPIQAFIPQLAVKGFHIAVFPRIIKGRPSGGSL